MSEMRQLGDEIQDAKRSVQDFSDSTNQKLEESKKNTEKLMEREKITNKDKHVKTSGKIDNLRARVDKDSEQLLRQDNQMTEMSIQIRGDQHKNERDLAALAEKLE